MIEAPQGTDLWTDIIADAIVITTNGDINITGRAVMGRGCALEATQKVPDVALRLGRKLITAGNHVHLLCHVHVSDFIVPSPELVSFPVKHHWDQKADLQLIERSVGELLAMADQHDWQTIVMPRAGCGNGKLLWDRVRPILSRLDDRFVVVHK